MKVDDVLKRLLLDQGTKKTHVIKDREALEHGLLRLLKSNLRSEVISEVLQRPPWP